MTDLFSELQPKQLDLQSVKSNSTMFYATLKEVNHLKRKKKDTSINNSIQILEPKNDFKNDGIIKNSLSTKNNYILNKKNFRKDICAKRDYVPVNQTQTEDDKKSWKTMNSFQINDHQQLEQIVDQQKLNELQNSEKLRNVQFAAKFQKYFNGMYYKKAQNQKSLTQFNEERFDQYKNEQDQKYRNDQSIQEDKNNKYSQKQLYKQIQKKLNISQSQDIQAQNINQSMKGLQNLQQQINEIQEKNQEKNQDKNQDKNSDINSVKDIQEFQLNKKQIQILLQNYPQLDIKNLDNQNLDYIAHLLGICQCIKCECNTCKCPYAINHNKYRYNFHDLQTSNGVNHNLETQKKIQSDLDCRFPYETGPYKEQINKNSIYNKDFDIKVQPEQFQKYRRKKKDIPFVNLSTNQANYPFWKKQVPDILKNLQQINIQKKQKHNNYLSSYQDSYQFINQKPEFQPQRKHQPEQYTCSRFSCLEIFLINISYKYFLQKIVFLNFFDKSKMILQMQIDYKQYFQNSLKEQPFQYQSQNALTYQGQYNEKSKPYTLNHKIIQSKQLQQASIYQKMNNDLKLGNEKLCPSKLFDKEALKQQILIHLQS